MFKTLVGKDKKAHQVMQRYMKLDRDKLVSEYIKQYKKLFGTIFQQRSDNRYYLSNFCSLSPEDISEYKAEYLNKVYHIVLNIAGTLLEYNLNNRELCIKLNQQRLEHKYTMCAKFRREIGNITAFMYDEEVEINTTSKYQKIHDSYEGIFDYLFEKLLVEYNSNYIYKVFTSHKPVIQHGDFALYTQTESAEINNKIEDYKVYLSLWSLLDVSKTILKSKHEYKSVRIKIAEDKNTISDYMGDYTYIAHQVLDITI